MYIYIYILIVVILLKMIAYTNNKKESCVPRAVRMLHLAKLFLLFNFADFGALTMIIVHSIYHGLVVLIVLCIHIYIYICTYMCRLYNDELYDMYDCPALQFRRLRGPPGIDVLTEQFSRVQSVQLSF